MAKVLIMAGGTGGHIFPALAVAQELRVRGQDVIWLGAKNGMETQIVPNHDFPMECVSITGLRGQKLLTTMAAPWRLARALWQTWQIFRRTKPDLVVGLGGFVTGPGGVMSWLHRIPLVIHEQNAVAGLTNRLLSRIARKVLTAFPDVFSSKKNEESSVTVVGNPIRNDISNLAEPNERLASHFNKNNLNVLVLGGSRGALHINEVVPKAINLLKERIDKDIATSGFSGIQIKHQSGKGKQKSLIDEVSRYGLKATDQNIGYQVMEFIDDMAAAYEWADIVVCRSGALTIGEISMVGVGSVLVPYPFAVDDHQTANGKYLENAGAAFMVQQKDFTDKYLADLLAGLTPEKIMAMGVKAKTLAYPDATKDVADICMSLIKSDVQRNVAK